MARIPGIIVMGSGPMIPEPTDVTRSDYYNRRNTLTRLIKDSSVEELVELIKQERLTRECNDIAEGIRYPVQP